MRIASLMFIVAAFVACAAVPPVQAQQATRDADVQKRITQQFLRLGSPLDIDGEFAEIEMVTEVFVTDTAGVEHKARVKHRPIKLKQAARLKRQIRQAITAKRAELKQMQAKLQELNAAMAP